MSEAKIPNVRVSALVPADFRQFADNLGYTVEEYLWLLAENACAVPRESVRIVTLKSSPPASKPANVVAFPRPPIPSSGDIQPSLSLLPSPEPANP